MVQDKQTADFEVIKTRGQLSDSISPFIVARLRGLDEEKNYRQPQGVDILPPEDGATQWSIFSSPVEAHKDYYNFNFDAHAVLTIASGLDTCALTRVARDIEKKQQYHEANFDLLSGRPLGDSLRHKEWFIPENEVRVGSTLDLSETSSVLGERLKRGLDLCIRKVNREGGINDGFVRIFFADDKYTPSLTLQNVQKFISQDNTRLILSPLGTPTTKVLVPLSEEKEILLLFPYTGANIFRDHKLKNILHYRASYADEARALVHYAKNKLFKQRFAFFFQDDEYGYAPLQASKKLLLEEYNLPEDAICEASYQRNTVLVDHAVETIEKYNPDVIFFFSTYAPSRTLIEKLGVQRLSSVTLMGISFLTDRFRDFASGVWDPEQQGKGLSFIISRVVPNPENSLIEIVKEYQVEMQREYPGIRLDVDSLEGYINANLLLEVLKKIDRPYTHKKIIREMEKIKDKNFKGLILNFDSETRSLSKNVWLDLGNGAWIFPY